MDDSIDIVTISNKQLISLIKDQPALYDKTLPPLDHNEKQILWSGICKELVADWEERPALDKSFIGIKVYSRWKHLKICFRMEYHLQREEEKALEQDNTLTLKNRKKYEFYNQLLFLLPTINNFFSKIYSNEGPAPKERQMTSRAVSPIVFEDSSSAGEQRRAPPPSLKIPGINLPSIQISRIDPDQADQLIVPGQTAQAMARSRVPLPMAPRQADQSNAPGQAAQAMAPSQVPLPIAPRQADQSNAPGQAAQPIPTGAAHPMAPRPPVDEDRHFLLSVLPSLQRMTRSQKLKAKMKFLKAISDVEAEGRATMRRFLCFASHASDNPESFPRRVQRRLFMQPDHTYYLVRNDSNKRARMMSESTGTVPQPNAENSEEMAEDAQSHESIEIGNLQETAEYGSSQETAEVGNLLENVDVGNSQENVEIGNVKETVEIGNAQETVEVGNSLENVEIVSVQETADVDNRQENCEVGIQENVASGREPMDIAAGKDELMEE